MIVKLIAHYRLDF